MEIKTLLILIMVWVVTGFIVLKLGKEELPWKVVILRLILAPLLLVVYVLEEIFIRFTSLH